jgi:hypothetical protein
MDLIPLTLPTLSRWAPPSPPRGEGKFCVLISLYNPVVGLGLLPSK